MSEQTKAEYVNAGKQASLDLIDAGQIAQALSAFRDHCSKREDTRHMGRLVGPDSHVNGIKTDAKKAKDFINGW